MHIEHLIPEAMSEAYDIRCQRVVMDDAGAEPPFAAVWVLIQPGERTRQHAHNDREVFVVLAGRGVVTAAGESREVAPGMTIHLPPFEQHLLENTSAEEDLVLLSLSWEDRQGWLCRVAPAPSAPRRVLVTAAPPTPNGDLHLGHLAGPYLAADVHRRYLAMRSVEVVYACGTDDNQSYVSTRAAELKSPPGELAGRMSRQILESLELARARPEIFLAPGDFAAPPDSILFDIFEKLLERGHLVSKHAPHPYCARCDRFLFEAHIRGRCPHCDAPCGGNGCEACGRPNDSVDVRAPLCARCGTPPSLRPLTRWVFPLRNFAGRLRAFHNAVAMPARLRALCESVIADLPDVAVAHPADWGIQVPLDGFADHRFLAWFEMAARYLCYAERASAHLGLPGGWTTFWKDPEACVVQCFGFDNAFFYALFIPALMMAYDPDIRLPSAFIVNEFYRLDGAKFSTSRDHAIWIRDRVALVSPDVLRFHLAYDCPEAEETNFTHDGFLAVTTKELGSSGLAGWLDDLAVRVATTIGGVAPASGDWTLDHRHFYARIARLAEDAADAYDAASFSLQRAARVVCTLVGEAHRFARRQRSWGSLPRTEEYRTAIALELMAARTLALIVAPLMPELADSLWRALGFSTPLRWSDEPEGLPAGQAIDLRWVAGALAAQVSASSASQTPALEAAVAE
jgi:methionyl-tRNA synthetase